MRELRRQLASPISWLGIGLFALAAGGAFVINLNAFLDRSSEALSTPPPQPVNVNQLLIRPFLLQIGMTALLVLPLITARAYTRERRVGSLDLPPPPPVMNVQLVLATFAAMLALYAVMLLPSIALVATLFVYGSPEWGSIVSGYLGLLLIGSAFISVALFMSSLATGAAAAAVATCALSLMLAVAAWLARSGAPAAQPVFRYFSIGEPLDDFAKGVVDTGHIVSCLAITALGLFLTLHARQPATGSHSHTLTSGGHGGARGWTAIRLLTRILYPFRVLRSEPYSGPRRAERARQILPTSQGLGSRTTGYQRRALGWLASISWRALRAQPLGD